MTNKISLLQELVAFGLSETEATIYLVLLEYGRELGGTKLSLRANLHRQYIYLALPKLFEFGLIEEVGTGTHKKYKARPPIEIERIGRKRALEAGDLARELNFISNVGNEQEFEVLQGTRAIIEYELSCASRTPEGSVEHIIGGATELFSEMMGESLAEYLEIKKSRNISVEYIGTEDERVLYTKFIGLYPNQKYRFIKKLPKGRTHTVIHPDTVSFYSFLNPPLLYVVKSPVIAQNYKDFFNMLWEMGEE
jgi:sugar-specific transcriptional regulator TrmB